MPSEVNLLGRLLRARWLRIVLVLLAAFALLLTAVGFWLVRHAEPLVRTALIATLEQHFGSRVELGDFHFTLHTPSLTGATAVAQIDDLRIWLPAAAAVHGQTSPPQALLERPWIAVNHLRFTVALRLFRATDLRLSNIGIDGLTLLIPPKGYRPKLIGAAGGDSARPAQTSRPLPSQLPTPRIQVDRITCTRVFLEMERTGPSGGTVPMVHSAAAKPSAAHRAAHMAASAPPATSFTAAGGKPGAFQPAREPLQFRIASLVLTPDHNGGPIHFALQMTNPRPVGDVLATGQLGPWSLPQAGVRFDPGALPLSGSYRFEHADLATIRGIAGALSSSGSFSGILRRVRVDGQSATPDFRLTRRGIVPPASVGLPLHTRFTATVDGTNGDTVLDSVEATLGQTHFRASGAILRVEENAATSSGGDASAPTQSPSALQPASQRIGHDIQLQVRVDHGQIADLLQVATADASPLITGAVTLTNQLHLPPGADSFRQRLMLSGHFEAQEAHFTSPRIEHDLTQLSLRAQGHPDAQHDGATSPVASTMSGDFSLASGVLSLPNLVYQVPGAQILMRGSYTLEGGALDFTGDARMKASLSQLVGGWKGFLLSPLNRILAKNGAGTDVPIRLTGTRADPHFSIAFDRLGKTTTPSAP